MSKTNEKGFGIVEIVMAIVIVVLLGAVVYFYLQTNQKKDQPSAASLSPTVSASPQASTSTTEDAPAVLVNVKAFYKTYLSDYNSTTGPLFTSYVSKGYITQAAADQEKNATGLDPTSCSQAALDYDQYTFSTPTLKDSAGTMTVSGVYSGPPPKTVTIGVGLIKDGSDWKIDKFNCS